MMNRLTLPALLALLWAAPAQAQWPTTVRNNLPVAVDPDEGESEPQTLDYPNSSILVAFIANPQGIAYQILEADGQLTFNPARSASPGLYTTPAGLQIISDLHGGAILAWKGQMTHSLYAQRLDSLGNILWGDSAVTIYPGTLIGTTSDWGLCADGQGGFFLGVKTEDATPQPQWDLGMQHVSAAGEVLWGDSGLVAIAEVSGQWMPRLASDSQGGFYLTWMDGRPPYSYWGAVFMQRFDSTGQSLWHPADGLVLEPAGADFIQTLPDGRGGLMVHAGSFLYRVDPAGNILWEVGVSVGVGPDFVAGEPGYFYTGYDYDYGSASGYGIYAQRIDLQGHVHWPWGIGQAGAPAILTPGPITLNLAKIAYREPYLYVTGRFKRQMGGGYGHGVSKLMGQILDSTGATLFPLSGVLMSVSGAHNNTLTNHSVHAAQDGGLVAVFQYPHPNWLSNIYAKRMNPDGSLGGPVSAASAADGGAADFITPRKVTLSVSPNPFNPRTALSYELRAASYVSLRIYDTAGREVRTLVDGWREAGGHRVRFDGSGLLSGIYFVRLAAGEGTAVQKVVLLK